MRQIELGACSDHARGSVYFPAFAGTKPGESSGEAEARIRGEEEVARTPAGARAFAEGCATYPRRLVEKRGGESQSQWRAERCRRQPAPRPGLVEGVPSGLCSWAPATEAQSGYQTAVGPSACLSRRLGAVAVLRGETETTEGKAGAGVSDG